MLSLALALLSLTLSLALAVLSLSLSPAPARAQMASRVWSGPQSYHVCATLWDAAPNTDKRVQCWG